LNGLRKNIPIIMDFFMDDIWISIIIIQKQIDNDNANIILN
jgi:hypothetical protein